MDCQAPSASALPSFNRPPLTLSFLSSLSDLPPFPEPLFQVDEPNHSRQSHPEPCGLVIDPSIPARKEEEARPSSELVRPSVDSVMLGGGHNRGSPANQHHHYQQNQQHELFFGGGDSREVSASEWAFPSQQALSSEAASEEEELRKLQRELVQKLDSLPLSMTVQITRMVSMPRSGSADSTTIAAAAGASARASAAGADAAGPLTGAADAQGAAAAGQEQEWERASGSFVGSAEDGTAEDDGLSLNWRPEGPSAGKSHSEGRGIIL
jgi:hypothetical protein